MRPLCKLFQGAERCDVSAGLKTRLQEFREKWRVGCRGRTLCQGERQGGGVPNLGQWVGGRQRWECRGGLLHLEISSRSQACLDGWK